jgi:hypothetical protein
MFKTQPASSSPGRVSPSVHTNRLASALQNSQPRRKLTSTTLFLDPLCDSPSPSEALRFEEVLNDAWRNLNTSQFDVAPSMDETSVSDASGWVDRYGARRGGSGGCEGMIAPHFLGVWCRQGLSGGILSSNEASLLLRALCFLVFCAWVWCLRKGKNICGDMIGPLTFRAKNIKVVACDELKQQRMFDCLCMLVKYGKLKVLIIKCYLNIWTIPFWAWEHCMNNGDNILH